MNFMKELQERFPEYTIHPVKTTHHTNVLRLVKDGYPTFIAKTIWHDMSDPEGNMGIKAQDKAYRTEVKILKLLPKWWGIHLIDNFKTLLNRVIVTNEIINVPWTSYKKGTHDVEIAKCICKQLQWLHSHKIAHKDLELKNILLTDSARPLIIDFEKSSLMATKEQMNADYSMIVASMKEHATTKSIGTLIEDSFKGIRMGRRKTRRL
jgi:tRNA A-37 threonylcarbamoyl transferase component Bud32